MMKNILDSGAEERGDNQSPKISREEIDVPSSREVPAVFVEEKNQAEIASLVGKLNQETKPDQDFILLDCKTRMADGVSAFSSLLGDPKEIQRKMGELDNRSHGSNRGYMQSPYFLGLDDLGEEDLKREYEKFFESQTSETYLGGIINAIYMISFNRGFFAAMNGKSPEIDETLLKIIRIVQKLVNVSQNLD